MLLDREWLISAHVSKIGDVFLLEGRLLESETGRVINAVSYDFELSIEGLYTRGMHNFSELIMSKRIPGTRKWIGPIQILYFLRIIQNQFLCQYEIYLE